MKKVYVAGKYNDTDMMALNGGNLRHYPKNQNLRRQNENL